MLQLDERLPEAETAALTAVKLAERDFGQSSDHSASAYHELGNLLAKAKRHHEAAEAFRKSLAILEAIQDTYGRNYATTRWTLGRALREQGYLDDAERELKHSLDIVEQHLGGTSYIDYWRIRQDLALTLEKKEQYDLALANFLEVVTVLEQNEALNFQHLQAALMDVIYCLNISGRVSSPEMESVARKQLAIAERVHGMNHEARLDGLNNLAGALGAQGRFDAAQDVVLEAMELGSKLDGIGVKRQRLKSLTVMVQTNLYTGDDDVLGFAREALQLLEEISKVSEGEFEKNVRSFFLQVVQAVESTSDENLP